MKHDKLLKKSKFYTNNELIREHIATYKDYAILIKQESIKTIINEKEMEVHPSLIKLGELKYLKRINGNKIRKIKPNTLNKYQKTAMVLECIKIIDTY